MTKNMNNLGDIYDLFSSSSFLEYEAESKYLEWYSVEGSKRLSELSRQLRTFLNYRSAIIQLRFSRSQTSSDSFKKDIILKRNSELLSLSSRYTTLTNKVGVEELSVAEKIRILMQKIKIQPKRLHLDILKEIKYLGNEMWKNIHILSEFDLHFHPQVLNMVIKIACILSNVEGIFFLPFSKFYCELKRNYLQLERELSGLLFLTDVEQVKLKKKKQVGILE